LISLHPKLALGNKKIGTEIKYMIYIVLAKSERVVDQRHLQEA
jgi:hypothetical protein